MSGHTNFIVNDLTTWVAQPSHVHAAFTHQSATKVKLDAGFKLCKLSDFPSIGPPGAATLSEWWSPYNEYEYDAGFETRLKMARDLNVSIRELSRVLVAVKENWNSLNYLLIIELRQPVFAFFGGVAGQARKDAGTESKVREGEGRGTGGLVGNASQFYIPNLTAGAASLLDSRSLS